MTEPQRSLKAIVGRAERIDFPEVDIKSVPARIDTGAKTSALWVSSVTQKDGVLTAVFFGSDSAHYTGRPVVFDHFQKTVVASSNGHTEERYKVRILIKLHGKRIRGWFTLADRSTQVYPVLIGRNVLRGKFVVDVKHGNILHDVERARSEALQSKLSTKKPENK